jgi:hypothetical protein
MGSDFFIYLERLEMIGFFSAYPLVYAIIHVIIGNSKRQLHKKIPTLLPYAYALVGTLYLGLQLKNLSPDFSFENIKLSVQEPILKSWALLSILFWIPAVGRNLVFTLLHSLIFFIFLVRDLLLQLSSSSADKNVVRNDMKLYTDSILLNLGALAFIILISYLHTRYKKRLSYRSGN